MEIRLANNHDIKSWMELLMLVKQNFPGLDMEDYRKGLLDSIQEKNALAAMENDVVIGGLLFSKKTQELAFLAVHPQHHRRGVATALIQRLFADSPKGSRITVITYRKGDRQGFAARQLYEKIGFVPGSLITVYDYPCQEYTYTVGDSTTNNVRSRYGGFETAAQHR